ncbi:fibronectin type III domain-containing protein, partial [Pontimonas sp.]|nr:fibronectin type III domain-containing protein [Pontimonas sp.]
RGQYVTNGNGGNGGASGSPTINAGGSGSTRNGDGGGGADEVGQNASSNPGNGGDGISSVLTGTAASYGGGGGGGGIGENRASGGAGGGGAGGYVPSGATQALAGHPNTGGGGGGGADTYGGQDGASGGSGLVVIRYSTAPGVPTSVSLASGDGQATITYLPPAHTGGGTITGYEYSLDSGSSWTSLGETDGSTVISGLTNGVVYPISLRALNSNGLTGASASATVLPSTTGEILRLDGTNSSSYSGSGSTWTDLARGNNGTINGATWDSRSKSFGFDGTNDEVDLPDLAYDFSAGLAIHAVVDFGSAENYETVLGFSEDGSTKAGISFGRYGTANELYLEIYDPAGTGYRECHSSSGGTAIKNGFHVYSAILLANGTCQLQVDGTDLTEGTSTGGGASATMLPASVVRADAFVGRGRGGRRT